MAAMSDLATQILIDLENDIDPRDIARRLEIPLSWVYETVELFQGTELDVELEEV